MNPLEKNMKKYFLFLAAIFTATTATMADQWVGGSLGGVSGQSGITNATIKAVRTNSDGFAFFSINQSSATVPANRIWRIDARTAFGANILANVIAAKSAGSPIQFVDMALILGSEYTFDQFTYGNQLQ